MCANCDLQSDRAFSTVFRFDSDLAALFATVPQSWPPSRVWLNPEIFGKLIQVWRPVLLNCFLASRHQDLERRSRDEIIDRFSELTQMFVGSASQEGVTRRAILWVMNHVQAEVAAILLERTWDTRSVRGHTISLPMV